MEGTGKKSKIGDEFQVDWVHDAREDEECGIAVRDIEQRGRSVIITKSKSPKEAAREKREVECAEIIRNQLEKSKGYLHEVGRVEVGECVQWSARKGGDIYQVRWGTTSWITNMKEVSEAAKEMRRKGEGWGAVVKAGVRNFMKNKGMITEVDEHVSHGEDPQVQPEEGEFWDSVSGVPLKPQLVKRAREEEMREFSKHGVYVKVPVKECLERTGRKPIGVKWVDINKGDEESPEYRSRLVAKEIKRDKREDLFAATPPLEALKILLSLALTEGTGYVKGREEEGMKIEFIDIKRAYLQAEVRREVYVELPPEDKQEGMCAKLTKAMYGTRDAAQSWEATYRKAHEDWGFQVGSASPCIMFHPKREIRLVVHGDDFTALGWEHQLDWYRGQVTSKFESKVKGRIGPAKDDLKSMRVLNRLVQWTSEGIEYEADQRHAELIIQELGLQEGSKSVNTPGESGKGKGAPEGDEEELSPTERTWYRGMVARGNYLAQDRCDIQYAIKELSRGMQNPSKAHVKALKRLGRYLIGRTRYVILFRRQGEGVALHTQVDTDHAGCLKTRKSTSGGITKLGRHTIRTWSLTQAVIALSSGEAEYYGVVKGASFSLGTQSLLRDMGIHAEVHMYTDSSAAKGIASRRGLGKVRHIEVNQLWLQDQVHSGKITLTKIAGTDNCADILTKHASAKILEGHLRILDHRIREGRHVMMPSISLRGN